MIILCPICEALGKTNLLLRDGDAWWCAMHNPLPRGVARDINRQAGLPVEESLPLLGSKERGARHWGEKI